MKLLERERSIHTYGKFRLFFNVLILAMSVSLTLFIILERIWDYPTILASIVSTLVSFLCFYYLKLVLQKNLASDISENVEVHEPVGGSQGRQTLLLFVLILLMLVTPLIILFLIPHLWLIILNGIVSGAAVSELVLYFKRR